MRHRVSAPEPHSHLFHVEVALDHPGPAPVFALPVWTPGSYLVREFARHLEGFAAEDGAGRPLPVERLDKHRFRVAAGDAARVVLRYRVYANDLTVRTCHLDGTHGFFNGAGLLFSVEGRAREPQLLEVVPPAGWRVATALDGDHGPFAESEPAAGKPWLFRARDYDELVDSPVEMGTHRVARFEALGRPHAVAVWGRGNVDLERFAADLAKVVETLGAMMGGLPYDRYLFLVHLADRRRGGLEHARSTTLLVGRHGFFPREAYEETLALAAHEFFHVWNVKGLRPAALTPYAYGAEQYTRLLWWFEGVTSYVEALALPRAGLSDARRFLKHLGEELTQLERTPGAAKASLEEASLLAWIKYYRPDENAGNSSVSYYLKGELVALALDLALRRAGRSLDALVRLLWERHASRGGLPEDGVERTVAELLGADFARAFFDQYVRGTAPLAPALDLDLVGLRLRRRAAQGFDDKGGAPPKNGSASEPRPPGFLGAGIATGPKLLVQAVREGSPAWHAGLYAEDEIVAEDGFRVDRGALWQRLEERGPGGALRLSVFRRDELVEVTVTLGAPPEDTVWIEPLPDATATQREAFQAWAGVPFPG
jgi:predicted metalloprotease with PDZ domain